MFEDTLIIWGGEFGRTPMSQGDDSVLLGRDHHIKGFSMWLAGGGIKGGTSYGATDELGYSAVENVVCVHDLHATMLDQLEAAHQRIRKIGRREWQKELGYQQQARVENEFFRCRQHS